MNKNKEKHNSPEETGKNGQAPNAAAKADKPDPADKSIPAGEMDVQVPAEQKPEKAAERKETEKPAKTDPAAMAEKEIADLKDQLLRLHADFDNYRKRVLRDKAEIYENANEALMLELLPVLDHFQLALQSAGKHHADRPFRDGLQLIHNQLMESLSKHGLAPFDSERQTFDPKIHEAISAMPSETEPEGVILIQSRPGYNFKNKLLRPAQVVVSSGKPAAAQAAQDAEKK